LPAYEWLMSGLLAKCEKVGTWVTSDAIKGNRERRLHMW
jgi:hypothetical protein